MAAKNALERVRDQAERLRKESLDTVVAANRILYQGVQRIADHELKALNETYRNALASLKKSRGGSPKDTVARQLDILQDSANRVIASARDVLAIVTETRQELTRLMQRNVDGGKVSTAQVSKVAKRARKLVDSATASAKKATKKATKTARSGGRTAKKTVSKASAKAKTTARKSAGAASRQVGAVRKTPNSRASRATSRAKKIASPATPVAPTAESGGGDTPKT